MLTLEKFREIKSRMTNEGLKGDQHQLDHDKDGKIEGEDLAKLRAKKMKKEEAEQLDELSKETLGSYKHKAELSIPKDDRAYANRSKGIDRAEKKMKKEDVSQFDEALDPSEIAGNPRAYDVNTVKKAYNHKKVTPSDKKSLEKHLDSHHGSKNWKTKNEDTSPFDEFTAEELEQFMQTEDYEQLDELSKKTLSSYAKKAMRDAAVKHKYAGDFDNISDRSRKPEIKKAADAKALKYKEKYVRRRDGVDKAIDRLTKEEAEQLDELSKKTLQSYTDKAAQDATDNVVKASKHNRLAYGAEKTGSTRLVAVNKKAADKAQGKANKRVGGLIKAAERMKEAAQYPRAANIDVKDAAANRAPAEKAHAAAHKVTVQNGIPDKHEDGADKVKGAAKAQPTPKKNYVEDEHTNKDIYIQSFKSYVQMRGDLERM
jgi:hypothetical protein